MTDKGEVSSSNDDNKASIPTVYSRILARELELQLTDLELLLKDTGLSSDDFLQEDTLLTSQQQIKILDNGYALANDQALGFRVGKRITPSAHGAIGFLVSSSPNLLIALQAFQTYLPSRIDFLRIETDIDKDWFNVKVYLDFPMTEETSRVFHEAAASIVFESAEFMLGRPLYEGNVYFPYPKPEYGIEYTDYIAGKCLYSSPYFRVEIPAEQCYIPNAATNHQSYMYALQQCEKLQSQLPASSSSYQYKLEKMMLSHAPGTLHEEEAAASLFISKRTLARKLKKEGTSFRQIRDEILAKQAAEYLGDSDFSVDTIATLLNYHDAASFRRAFRRWYNMPPDEFRRGLV